ncbi:HEAT repeat-containing protein 1 [Stylophora pistillata]|uniref:HEAT repeat-containing protein 1 n=1 Tax=Stylophora pistillata TaxID=50429 RepID=A0A2B4RVJ7_STYPI|nr:HEAT repeat-containing protein 1 [Stylophora pistillata]
MTSLAKQLQQLQIPGSLPSTATVQASKKSSLLFDSKEAADIDNETVFSIGLNGLEELKVIEPAFRMFEKSLFGDNSMSLERSLQTKDVNEKLDQHISKFLQYLSPYFLLKPAHKVLEWLIRRFQIHVYNVDSLVTCILPYHETNLFTHVLQLLSIKDPSSKWNWLSPIKKAGVPLSKSAFLQHCVTDPAFFSLICDMVMEGTKLEIPPSSLRILFTFYTSAVVGALDMMPSVTEKFITQLLPHLLAGLKSELSELVTSSYMITAQLCFRCSMDKELVKSLSDSICKSIKPRLATEGLSCLTFICQSQGLKKLSKRSFKALLKLPRLVNILHNLSLSRSINPLLEVFVPQLVSNGIKQELSEESDTRGLLENLLKLLGEVDFEPVLVTVTGRYPIELERAIEAHLQALKNTEDITEGDAGSGAGEGSRWTMDLVSLALTGVKSQVIPDSNTTLVLSLHHPQAQVREMAIKRLGELLAEKGGLSEDKHFISDSLLLRIQDDDPSVVACVLKLGQGLVDNLPTDQFLKEMFKLLDKKSEEWDKVREEASLLLVGDWVTCAVPSLVAEVMFGLLPRLLLHRQSHKMAVQLSLIVSQSELASLHPLLSGMKEFVEKKEWKSCTKSVDLDQLALASSLLISWLGENLVKLDEEQLVEMVQSMIAYAKSLSDESLFHPLLESLLRRVLATATEPCKMMLCQVITEFILPDIWKVTRLPGNYEPLKVEESRNKESDSGNIVPFPLLKSLVKFLGKRSNRRLNHAKGAITLWLCKVLIKTIPAEPHALSGQWWQQTDSGSEEGSYTKLLTVLFEAVAFGSGTSTVHQDLFKELLQDLFQCHLPDKLVLLKFVGHLWCKNPHQGRESVSALLQVQCLHIGSACLGSISGRVVKELAKTTCSGFLDMLQTLLPVVKKLLDKCEDSKALLHEDESTLLQLIVQKYTPDTAALLQIDSKCWKEMLRVLSLRSAVCPGHPAPLFTMIGQITNRFFQAIPAEGVKQHLLKYFVDTMLETKDVAIVNAAKNSLLKITLTADLITEELCKLKCNTDKEPKKKKVKKARKEQQHEENEGSEQLQRVTVVLELLQSKINIEEPHRLLPTLFGTLARCVELDHSQTASEYIMQLVFSLINKICEKLSPNSSASIADLVPEDQFDVELIVQCIRSSENPRTHTQALLLLATSAHLFPEKVLHNVMSIFTFMGASVVRQDDSYSFEVITKTLDTVIPALIQAGEEQQFPQLTKKDSASLDDIVAMLIRVFVDASPHIPEHRQLPLFAHLIDTVGSTQFLHSAIILLLEKHVVHSLNTSDDKQTTVAKKPLGADFCLSLCHCFQVNVQVEAMLKLLQFIDQLPLEKPEVRQKPRMARRSARVFLAVTPLFDVDAHSAKHLRQFKYTSVSVISSLLNSDEFVSKVHVEEEMLDSLFLRLLQDTLNFMTKTAQHGDQANPEVTGKFWKALLHKTYEIIDKVNHLLPASVFFNVIEKLLHSSNGTVRRKAIELLNSKLGNDVGAHSDEQIKALLNLVTELLAISRGSGESEESVINRQTALYSLKLLTRLLAKEHPDEFKEVMTVAIDVFSSKDSNAQVASSALLCAAEVLSGLKTRCISFLPKLMPSVLKLLKITQKERNSLLILCGVTALYKATEALPHFLSPYLVDILILVTQPSLTGGEVTEAHQEKEEVTKQSTVDVQLKDRVVLLRKELACNIAPRVLISAVSDCYSSIVDKHKERVLVLMDVLAECVKAMKKEDIKTHHSNLFTLFLEALDFRTHHNQELTKPNDLVIHELPHRRSSTVSLETCALCSFTAFLCVANKLKGLFVLFAGYIVKNCASLLDATNNSKTAEIIFQDESPNRNMYKTCLLVNYMLDCLHKCFMYDTHGFLESDRIQCLMQPLVDQIENMSGGEDTFRERLANHLAPCLAQFAVASGSDAHWKPLNYQVLLKTRHSSSTVRFAALKVLEGFHAKLGEEFMVLLPESIPFLAELMEDECFEVEQQCQHLISEIEQVLGEPLQKYF